jgi:hypothetical protein
MIATAAWICAGIALWFTRGVLDVFSDAGRTTRVAMLPSAPELLGLVTLSLLIAAGVAASVRRWTQSSSARADAIGQIALPLFGLALVVLPYLPWLPDGVAPLRALAGPLVKVVWFAIAGQVLLTFWNTRERFRGRTRSVHTTRVFGTIAILLLTAAMSGTAAVRLEDSLTYPTGDEPHYMVMMRSVWRDHDLKIENNYANRDYADFYQSSLGPDLPARGKDGELYSAHPIGLAVIGAPVLAYGGYHAVVWMLVLLTTLTSVMMWRWVLAFTGSGAAATVAWATVFLGAPLLFSSIAVYPDIPAAFCVMLALAWRSSPNEMTAGWPEYLVRGLAVSALPWLSMTYAPMAAALVVLLGLRAVQHPKAVLATLLPFTISLVCWFGFFYLVWGHASPMAPYGATRQFGNPLVGVLGLLFDQEFGVLIYAPALTLGFVGLWRMLIAGDPMTRARGREVAIAFGVLLVSVGALADWWGAAASPGRPLAPALPLLGLPIAWLYQRTEEGSVRRAAYQLLVLIGLAVSLAMLLTEQGALIVQDRDGSSRLLQWVTMLWPTWQIAPAIAGAGLRNSAGLIGLWILAAFAVAWSCARNPSRLPGTSALMATIYLSAGLLVVALVSPAIARSEPASVTEPQARSRLPILDNFDSQARPHAIIYRPFSVARAADIPPLMTMRAGPEPRTGGQPVRVFLNARYALATGDYRVEIGGLTLSEPAHGTVGLQVGRIGPPLREWQVDLAPGATWRANFNLPVDAEFVGFLTSGALSSASSLRITPLTIVDRSRRDSIYQGRSFIAFSSVAFPSASVFFHDEAVYPERSGVWVHGASAALMTIASSHPDRGVTLRVHSGARPNTVTFATTTWGARVDLVPGTPQDVHIPPPASPGPFLLRVTTARGFVPAEVMPGNTDRRILGCWMEIAN